MVIGFFVSEKMNKIKFAKICKKKIPKKTNQKFFPSIYVFGDLNLQAKLGVRLVVAVYDI